MWTDSFNLSVLDDELIDLLPKAGCIRTDIGLVTFNNNLQKFYNNIIQDDRYLENLEKIHRKGIWVDISMIANLPYNYSSNVDIGYLDKYHQYIDSVTLNSYRAYKSEMVLHPKKYRLNVLNENVLIENKIAPMYFIEKDFKKSLEERKMLYRKNYLDLKDFFSRNSIILNSKYYYALVCLYNHFGFKNKNKIKENIVKLSYFPFHDKIH